MIYQMFTCILECRKLRALKLALELADEAETLSKKVAVPAVSTFLADHYGEDVLNAPDRVELECHHVLQQHIIAVGLRCELAKVAITIRTPEERLPRHERDKDRALDESLGEAYLPCLAIDELLRQIEHTHTDGVQV